MFLKESTPVREKKALVDSSHKKKGVSFPSRLLREGSDIDPRALRPHGPADVLSVWLVPEPGMPGLQPCYPVSTWQPNMNLQLTKADLKYLNIYY